MGSRLLMIATWLLAYLLVVNLATWLAFRRDKRAAADGARRTPERTLLFLALLGGTPAAFLARSRLHHKSRKTAFGLACWFIAGSQLALLAILAWRLIADAPAV